ncbi:MAG TPA: asparaginase [Longimicrobiales bacterium]
MAEAVVEVRRGDIVESRHEVHIAVVDGSGRLRAHAGNPGLVAFARSTIKPMQTVPIIEDGAAERFAFTEPELALCCASHSGEPRHVAVVEGMLRKIGAAEDALACGPHVPMGRAAAEELAEKRLEPRRVHNNCSGKHAGMLALARVNGWPLAGYHEAGHPVQERMQQELARWAEMDADDLGTAVDGCGVITFALPVERLALAFARFAAAARRGDTTASTVVQAMMRNPEYIAGTDRMCTELMRVARGRIFAKVGAEGVYCAGIPGAELGIALKVDDGATRAAEPALIATLNALAILSDDEVADLALFAEPDISNTRGERVGELRARIRLEAHHE